MITRFVFIGCLLAGAGCTNTLNRAIYRENPEAIQKFLAQGADVNLANEDGGTPLIYAAQYGDLALIKTLVDRGATVNAVERHGESALGYLVSGKGYKKEIVVFLLAHGADVNLPNKEGRTALHEAVMRQCQPEDLPRQNELVALLLEAGADANRATNKGELPLHLAAAAGQSDQVLGQLLHATKDPQALTQSGYHALSEAARGGQHEAALFLAGHGFEPQKLVPSPQVEGQWPVVLELSHPINARAQEAVGDYLLNCGERYGARACYRSSATSYEAAVSDCEHAVNLYADALKDAKAGRKSRLASTIALNVIGGGIAAATGVGFYTVPKRVNNHIDEYAEELERDRAELTRLTEEQSELSNKLAEVEKVLKAQASTDNSSAQIAGGAAPPPPAGP